MADNSLGDARCPLCGGTAKARLSSKGLAYLVMDCCNAQLFTRSARSDELVRDLIRSPVFNTPEAVIQHLKAPDPAPAPAVPQVPKVAPPPPTPSPKPAAPTPAPAGAGLGLLKGWFA